jgi:hypothetical protein
MTYTVNEIKILHPFVYKTNAGMQIPFLLKGERSHQLFSNQSFMETLKATGIILDFNVSLLEVKKTGGHWVRMEHFIEYTFDDLIAEEVILHYLNNRTAKPSCND